MSLYNALFGENPFSSLLLEAIGTKREAIPRYRDCYLSADGTEIIVHTRTGGGNRDDYDSREQHVRNCTYEECKHEGPYNEDLRKIPGFKADEDESFDSTYANFHFEIPEPFKPQIELLRNCGAVSDPAARWQELLVALKAGDTSKPEVQRALAVGERIAAEMNKADKSDGCRIITI